MIMQRTFEMSEDVPVQQAVWLWKWIADKEKSAMVVFGVREYVEESLQFESTFRPLRFMDVEFFDEQGKPKGI
jgi:hypothetical protein